VKKKVYLADLTHTGNGIIALTFPLGTAFVASYASMVLGDQFDFRLFKFPDRLSQAIVDEQPQVLALANYSWNLEMDYKLSQWAKARNPDLVVVFGGPNFPVASEEKREFLRQRETVDFYVEIEGEIGFADLLQKLDSYSFDVAALKAAREPISNCTYLSGDDLVEGQMQRIKDVNIIPSPYLSGILDEFFDLPLSPMIETTRGCPFSCAFCADGLPIKNKVAAFDSDRVRDELYYIAEHIKNVDELTITDLNFGMYKRDVETARSLAEIQNKYGWPGLVRAAAGKNRPERIIEAASLLKGSWVIGSAIQSSDQEVLKNIKRSNISLDAYREFLDFMNGLDKDAQTYTEIILALPGDTKEKHFESLRYGIENQVNSVRMYQAILLSGTDMASPETREKFQLLTKFRVMPGGVGVYKFGDDDVPVAEIEEIIVGSKDMPFQDYVSCRIMNLLVETYLNNALCEEIFAAMRAMGLSVSDFLFYLFEHDELYSPKMKEIIDSFVEATRDDLYDSHSQAEASALSPELFDRYLSGELGSNELLEHKAMLYGELEDILAVLLEGVKMYLGEQGLQTGAVLDYFDELADFILCKKQQVQNTELEVVRSFKFDFESIDRSNYEIDPRTLEHNGQSYRFKFFHDEFKKEQIRNAVGLYEHHPGGISRMLYRQNLKKLYRDFQLVS